MEKIFYINTFRDYNDEEYPKIKEVNEILKKGAKVKMLCPTSNDSYNCAYVVVEMEEKER